VRSGLIDSSHLDFMIPLHRVMPEVHQRIRVYINFELKETLEFSQECVVLLFNIVLRFAHADTAVKENQMEKHLPYTTKSGLRIGCMYSPPPQNHMSADAERIQMALLGIEPEYSERRVVGFVAYIIFLAVLVSTLFALGV
jgi:hypothetical protein